MDSCPPHNFNGYGVCDCGVRNQLADSPESNSTDDQFSISGPARTINEGWFCYSGHCHNTQEGAVKCGEKTIVTVDEQFEQAVSAAAQALHAEEPGWPDTMAKAALDALHFRDYLELRSAVDQLLIAIDDYATGSFGDPQDDCRDILARIDAHATEAT